MTNRYMRRCSTSVFIRKYKSKPNISPHMPVRKAFIKRTRNDRCRGEFGDSGAATLENHKFPPKS